MVNKKGALSYFWIFVILAIAAVILTGAKPGAIVLLSNDPNTFYQYAGSQPYYKYEYAEWYIGHKGVSNVCAPEKEWYDANIQFSNIQQVTVDGIKYDFVTSNVKQGQSTTSECGVIIYDVEVRKNGAVIDKINFPATVSSCSDYPSNKITKTYGRIKADFGFASETAGSLVCGKKSYVVHKYEIQKEQQIFNTQPTNQNQQNNTQTTTSTPIPNNETYIPSRNLTWFGRIWNFIKSIFGGLLG